MEGEKNMSQRTLARFKFVSIVIFVIGLVSATVAFSIQKGNGKKQRHRIGFTIVTKQSTVPFVPMQNSDWYTISVRYQKSDGTWRQVRTPRNAEGKVLKRDITVGVPGQGVFKVNKDQGALDFLSSMPAKEVTSY